MIHSGSQRVKLCGRRKNSQTRLPPVHEYSMVPNILILGVKLEGAEPCNKG